MEGEYLRLDTAKKIAKKGKEIERLNKDLEDLTIEELKKERNNTRKKIIRLNHTNVNNEFIMANVEAQKKKWKHYYIRINEELNKKMKWVKFDMEVLGILGSDKE